MTTLIPNKWCVYRHSVAGKVFYVGMGNAGRAFNTSTRGQRWLDAVAEAGAFEVEIVGWYETRNAASTAEAEEIARLRPSANIYSGGGTYVSSPPPNAHQGVRSLDERQFREVLMHRAVAEGGASALARRLRVHDSYLCHVLKGRRAVSSTLASALGYRTIAWFEKVA